MLLNLGLITLCICRAVISPQKVYEICIYDVAQMPRPSVVLLLAHHQMLCYFSLAKPDSLMKVNCLTSLDYGYRIVFVAKNVMAGISV